MAFVKNGQPFVSCDPKKTELVGEFSNGGVEWHPTGEPTRTKTHDFVDKDHGRELISAMTTKSGLKIRAERDRNYYETGVQVTKAELAALPLVRREFHGDWNYTLTPANASSKSRRALTAASPYVRVRVRVAVAVWWVGLAESDTLNVTE